MGRQKAIKECAMRMALPSDELAEEVPKLKARLNDIEKWRSFFKEHEMKKDALVSILFRLPPGLWPP